MRIAYTFDGVQRIYESTQNEIVFGRPKPGIHIDLDLSPDLKISRPHGRIRTDGSRLWIEDLNSRDGTRIGDRQLRGLGWQAVDGSSEIRAGDTVLTVSNPKPAPRPNEEPKSKRVNIGMTAIDLRFDTAAASLASDNRRLSMLYELPLQIGSLSNLDVLLQRIVEALVEVTPGAERGALLLKDSSSKLLLKAHVPLGRPSVSMVLAQRVMESGEAFVWTAPRDTTEAPVEGHIASGMYAPLVWKDDTLGIVCVDNSDVTSPFDEGNLQLMMAVARYAAMAIANHNLQAELRVQSDLLQRLLINFSPKVRKMLLDKGRNGQLRLGGERSEVALLMSDIRGFTRVSASMSSDQIVDMLNEFLSALTTIIFKYNGTVDKFIGDAILAVFGSPQADPSKHENSVRAALEMQQAVQQINERRTKRGDVPCEIGIGVHCGEVLHGFIGSSDRMEFTVIGDPVNRTSRYCSGAACGQVVISPELYQHVWRLFDSEAVEFETKHEGRFKGYRILAPKP